MFFDKEMTNKIFDTQKNKSLIRLTRQKIEKYKLHMYSLKDITI